MKSKFLSIFLALFIFVSSSCSSFAYSKQSRAFDMGVISLPMVATVVTLGASCGVVLNNDSDIYDFVNGFYRYHKDKWDLIKVAFSGSVALIGNTGKVNVGSSFLTYVKEYLNSFNSDDSVMSKFVGYYGDIPVYDNNNSINPSTSEALTFAIDFSLLTVGQTYYLADDLYFVVKSIGDTKSSVSFNGESAYGINNGTTHLFINDSSQYNKFLLNRTLNSTLVRFSPSSSVVSVPNALGNYDWAWDNDDDVVVGIPSDLSSLKGNTGGSVLNPSYPLSNNGIVSLPLVDNPSIDVDDTITFPLDGTIDTPSDVPVDTPFDAIKDFIISLVVPSDTFWTDTFGGLRGSFENAFPMLDMSSFESLVVGGKPFPNIDVDVMGVRGRVVDGDIINSIVDWLRPLIAGFIMLCLMFFNYRKIYKLIRNTEPFGNIAPGSSDFRTGMSAPGMSEPSNYEIARDQIRDLAFEMRNEILHRKHNGGV